MSEFVPNQWAEEQVPKAVEDCKECGLYKHGSRMVWGEGNPNAPILILLDNPGAREDREGNPFVCGTRQALQQAAYAVGLTDIDLYTTYILKRKPTRAYDKETVRNICMRHLEEQLQVKEPYIIFCLGNVAVQSFFHNPNAEVKSMRGTIQQVKEFQTLVSYHPLAVRRRPNLWPHFIKDWENLADFYRLFNC
ncbi:uracil-DNA glycosylase family protein [Bacillus sp. EB600]|uniref:uracil-DNA glycosylase n=1 Tax=Bacillus sp. EB600 TaxID=2806345 RepID=UPI00210938D2|nr:uracil-DNA glycosylase [Bacillus sp. EB600]MCQ6281969.1 uracil-DNA glycosylase [Bacillus sp. EB600]